MKKRKYDGLSAEQLRDLAEPLTDEELENVNCCFPSYVFYRTLKDGARECFCSVCRKHFVYELPRTFGESEVTFIQSKHNDVVVCPRCGAKVRLKNIGKVKNGHNLWFEWKFVIPQVINKNAVLLRCYYAHKSYTLNWWEKGEQPQYREEMRFCSLPKVQLSRVYLLQPGSVQNARLENFWYGSPAWWLRKSANEPFYGMFGSGEFYDFLGIEKLKKTFLKYAAFEEFKNIFHQCTYNYYGQDFLNIVTFFCRSAEYPALEILCKLGFVDPVRRLIYGKMPCKRLINWQAVKPWEIFRLPKEEYKVFETYVLRNEHQHKRWDVCLKIYKDFQKLKIKGGMNRACEWASITDDYWKWEEKILTNLKLGENLTHVENYLKKQVTKTRGLSSVLGEWDDYLNMAKKLSYDLTQEVVKYPKNLKKAHDTAAKTLNQIREEQRQKENAEKEKQAAKLVLKYKKQYEYRGEEYSIIIPEKVADIVREGQLMQHCVGGYAARHFEGKLCICFLRKNDDIENPYYTIEMRNKTLVQIQGFRNAHPVAEDPKAEKFFNEWLEWVKNGSKKKEKKSAEAA